MSEDDDSMTEYWRDLKAASQEKRASNRESSAQILKRHGITFRSANEGAHLIVKHAGTTIDFWPGTGKWIARGFGAKTGRGVVNLLRHLGA